MEKPVALLFLIGLILAAALASQSRRTDADFTHASSRTGHEVYKSVCGSCHDTGVANAPKPGSREWKKRLHDGPERLLKSALKGMGVMPRKGSCIECSEEEIRAAVAYLAGL